MVNPISKSGSCIGKEDMMDEEDIEVEIQNISDEIANLSARGKMTYEEIWKEILMYLEADY